MTILSLVQFIAGAVALFVVAVFATALKKMFQKEIEASVPDLSRHLLSRAIGRLPVECREDYEEEWRGELGDAIERRPLWALAEVTSLYFAAGRIAVELQPATASVKAGSDSLQSGSWGEGPRSLLRARSLRVGLRSVLQSAEGVRRAAARIADVVGLDPANKRLIRLTVLCVTSMVLTVWGGYTGNFQVQLVGVVTVLVVVAGVFFDARRRL